MTQASASKTAPVATADPDALYEVVDGRRVELWPSAFAMWIASHLGPRLGTFVESQELGTVVIEMLFVLDPERDLKRRPDVAFVSAGRWPTDREVSEEAAWE